MVQRRIMDFGGETKVFNPNQFAYMKDRSMVTRLLSGFNDWSKSRNKRNPMDLILLDFSKAFDRALTALFLNGVRALYSVRSQRVVFRNSYSSWAHVKSGVHQGTFLGLICSKCT